MAAEPCVFLEWDTEFFGVRTARVVGDALTPARAAEVDAWCAANAVRWLYFLARNDDGATTRAAEDAGYRLVDLRLSLDRKMAGAAHPRHAAVRPFEAADLPALRRIARESYGDSRFYYDGRIPRETCDAFFEHWTAECAQGKSAAVLVAEQGGEVAGYVTCEIAAGEPGRGRIGLLGVDAAARGKGVGRALVESTLNWAVGRGLSRMEVVTQGRNLGAQRVYQRCGFVTRSLGLYYHKWYE